MTALRTGLLALGLAAFVPFAALAPSASRAVDLGLEPYIEYDAGVTFMRNQNLTRANPPAGGLSGHVGADAGFNVGGAIGTRFLEHFRTEISAGYHSNKVDELGIQANGNNDGKGTLSLVHALVNSYAEYDFGVGVIPYFGLGVGYGQVQLDAHNKDDSLQLDADDDAFLWNVMVGASVPISDVTTFSLGYRYLATEDLNFRARLDSTPGAAPPPIARQIDSEYDAHELVFGIRYSF